MDSLGYLLTAALLTLLNVHWWVWSAVVFFVCRRAIKTAGANDLIGSVVASGGIAFFEASVTPDGITPLEIGVAIVVVVLISICELARYIDLSSAESGSAIMTANVLVSPD